MEGAGDDLFNHGTDGRQKTLQRALEIGHGRRVQTRTRLKIGLVMVSELTSEPTAYLISTIR